MLESDKIMKARERMDVLSSILFFGTEQGRELLNLWEEIYILTPSTTYTRVDELIENNGIRRFIQQIVAGHERINLAMREQAQPSIQEDVIND